MMAKVIQKNSVSASLAHAMIQKAQEKADKIGIAVSVAVVDESGVMKGFVRGDRAPLISVDLCMKKAITAVKMGLSTGENWYNFIKDDPILMHGANNIEDFILFGGGSPIFVDNALVGGIGVSGGHYKEDEQCIEAALSMI